MSNHSPEVRREEYQDRKVIKALRSTPLKDAARVAAEIRLYLAAKRAKERRPAYRGALTGQVESRHRVGPSPKGSGREDASGGAR